MLMCSRHLKTQLGHGQESGLFLQRRGDERKMKGIAFASKSKPSALKPKPASKKSAFGGGDSDSEGDTPAPPSAASGSSSFKRPAPPPVKAANKLSRAQKAQLAAAEAQDASVFAYDEVFDSMKSAQQAARDAVKQESQDRKVRLCCCFCFCFLLLHELWAYTHCRLQPQYIENLLQTAEQRKLDHARAEDVMTQREREKEGDEFKDKESFVTPAYLAQQEEMRKAEEAEKAKSATSGGGMAKFYEQYLSSSAQAHQAASEAARQPQASTSKLQQQQQQVYDDEPVSDVHLAKEAATRLQKVVEVNEDGQVVDRTELLSGGLNIAPPRKKQGPAKPGEEEQQLGGFAIPIAERARREREERLAAQAASGAAEADEPHWSGRDRRELERERKQRQSAAVEKQILEIRKRQAEEAELDHQQQVQKVAKRNDAGKIEALKRAAAERKKAKAAEQQQQQQQEVS